MATIYSPEELAKLPFRDMNIDIEKRVDDLLSRLTLEEKFTLMAGIHVWTTRPIKRLGIEPFGTSDGPNGVGFHSSYKRNTCFPVSICFGASWNRELATQFGQALGQEVRAAERHIILAPGFNIDRTPLNGRTFEYLSEDPYLIKELIIPMVKSVQKQRASACIKHFAANNQETNRMQVNTIVSERTLREIYLKAFEEVVKQADPWSIMACYNQVNGQFGSENYHLLKEILVDEWGFKGFVMSDWLATKNIQSPESSIKAGLTLEMPKPIIYSVKRLRQSFDEKKFTEDRINELIRRLIRVMMLVGVFDDPKSLPVYNRNTPEHQKIARQMAEEGAVLLKNDSDLLPLNLDRIKTLAVLGPNANKKLCKPLYGGSSAVWPPHEITVLHGLKEKCARKIQITSDPTGADAVILVLGLNHDKFMDSEGSDRTQLELPSNQLKLIEETIAINPKTIIVLLNGSPIAMDPWIEKIPAVLEAWYPGMEGGRAIANILFGDVNPSGKLPLTFPKKLTDSPAHKSVRTFPGSDAVYYEEGIFVGYRQFDTKNIEPLFPFGFGLSYTTFLLSNLKISPLKIVPDGKITITVDVMNTGSRVGAEVVQLYIQDSESRVERPAKELKGFQKVFLQPGQSKLVKMEVGFRDLAFYDENQKKWVTEKGKFMALVGNSSRNITLKGEFEY